MGKSGAIRAAVTGCLAAVFVVGMASASFAATGPAGSVAVPALPNSATVASATSAVDAFAAAHTEPAIPAVGASVATQNAYWQAEVEYWKSVPWADVAEQWGCSFQAVQIGFQPADAQGVIAASYSTLTNCGVNASDDLTSVVSSPETTSHVVKRIPALATKAGRQTTSAQTGRATAKSASSASPDAAQVSDCRNQTDARLCVNGGTSSGAISATTKWLATSTTTGRARLGLVGAGAACAAGTQKAISALGTGGQGAVFTAATTTNQSTQWSSEYLVGSSTSVYARFCATL